MDRGWTAFSDRVAAWSLAGMTLLCSAGFTRGALRHGLLLAVALVVGSALVIGLACVRMRPGGRVLGWSQRAAYLLCVSTVCLTAVIQARRGLDRLVQMGGTAAVVVLISAVLAVVLPPLWQVVVHMLAGTSSVTSDGEEP